MKKKFGAIFVALICIMLCACGASESNNTEGTNDAQEFSIVGEWKFVSSGGSFIFNEDGTFESEYYGGGYKYEYTPGADVISIDLDGFGLFGLGMQELNVVYEDATYKIQANNLCLVPASEYERFNKEYQEQVAASEAEEQKKREERQPTPIEGIYLVSQSSEFPYGYYLDGKYRYTKVEPDGVSYGDYEISESEDQKDSSTITYIVSLTPEVTNGSAFTNTQFFYLSSNGNITSFEWVTNTEKMEFAFEQVDESTFYNAFN